MHALLNFFLWLYIAGAVFGGAIFLLIACLDFALENMNKPKITNRDWRQSLGYIFWSTLAWPHFLYAFLGKKTIYQ